MFNKPKQSPTLNLNSPLRSPLAESTKLKIVTPGSLQRTSQKRKPTSPLSNQRSLSYNSLGTLFYNRIDPKTYTDVKSNGLATRVAKYGQQSSSSPEPGDEKYKSLRTSFSKRSPFPSLTRKPELKNPPFRSNSLSSVRIAPPEKLIFQPASRSQIFRSGSLMTLPVQSKRDDEPLAPPSDVESIPITPSALDQLKETTRKRINNEELDAERIKKQCKEVTDIDGPSPNVVVAYKPPQIIKRGREIYGSNQSISPPELDAQKKRLKTKYNEITGSLSSSLSLQTPKRKASDVLIPNRLDLSSKPPPSVENFIVVPPSIRVEPEKPTEKVAPQPVVTSNTAPVANSVIKKPSSGPPPITLFNKKFDSNSSPRRVIQRDDDDSIEKIRFVIPKKDITFTTDPTRRVEPNRLKLLLNCLSGALEDDSDEVDTSSTTKQPTETATVKPLDNNTLGLVSEKTPTPTLTQPAISISFGTGANVLTSNAASIATSTQPTLAAPLQSKPLITSASSAFAVVSSAASITVAATTVNTSSTLPTFGIQASTAPSVEPAKTTGFTFGSTTTSVAPVSVPKATDKLPELSKPDQSVFGSVASSVSTVTTPKPAFSFGTTTTTTPNATNNTFNFGGGDSKEMPSPIKPLSNFSNTTTATNSTSIKPITTFGTAATTSSGFNFGGAPTNPISTLTNPTPLAPKVSSSALNETLPANDTSLGLLGDSTLNNTTFGSITASIKPFGSGFSTASATVAPSKPLTSTETNKTTVSVGPTFSLGANSNQTNTNQSAFGAQSTGGFNFKSPSAAGGFNFNPNASSTAAPTASNTTATSKSSVFSRLGTVAAKPETSTPSNSAPSKDLFTFTPTTTTTQQNPTAIVSPAKDLISFSPAPQHTSSSVFGSNANNIFKSAATTAQNSIFGGGNTTATVAPSFGSSSNSIFGSNSTANPVTQNQPSNAVFGNNSTFGNTTTTFGNSSSTSNTAGGNNVFGGNTTNDAASKPFSFTSSSNPAPAFNFTSSSGSNQQIFGGNAAQQSQPPAYGSQQNMFAQNANNNQGSASNTPTSPFSFSAGSQSESKPFAFGGSNTSSGNSGASSFNFTNQTQQQNNEPPKYSFSANAASPPPPAYGSFGGQHNNNANNNGNVTPSGPSFNFGGGAMPTFGSASTGSSAGSPAFNFNAGSGGGGLTPVTPAPLLPSFSIGTGGSQNQSSQRRPMRVASRRLK